MYFLNYYFFLENISNTFTVASQTYPLSRADTMLCLLLSCFPSSFKQCLIMTTFDLVFLTHKYSKKIKWSQVFPLECPHHSLTKGRGQELTLNMQGPALLTLLTWPHFLWSPLSLGHRDISSYRICLLCYLADFWTWLSLASLFSQLCKKIWNGELFSSDFLKKSYKESDMSQIWVSQMKQKLTSW